jgi:flagellar biosynthesis/type III secretory pathway protein FliH
MFQLEHSPSERDFVELVTTVTHWLSSPRDVSLKQDLVAWVKNVLVVKQLLSPEAIREINQLEELPTMLAEQIDKWEARLVAKGRTEGRTEGQAQLLIRLLEEKFGPVKTRVRTRISALDEPQVLECAKRLLTAKTVQEVLGRRPRNGS